MDNIPVSRSDAKAQGSKIYNTGKICRNGHFANRRTDNGGCLLGLADIERRYFANHLGLKAEKSRRFEKNPSPGRKESHRKAVEKWDKNNPDKVKAAARRRRQENPEKYRERDRLQAAKASPQSKERRKNYNKEYKRTNAKRLGPIAVQRSKQWIKDHPEQAAMLRRLVTLRRRARIKSNCEPYKMADVYALLASQNYQCAYCKVDISADTGHIDHYMPVAREGSDALWNLRWACKICNLRKSAKDPLDFLRELEHIFPPSRFVCEAVYP